MIDWIKRNKILTAYLVLFDGLGIFYNAIGEGPEETWAKVVMWALLAAPWIGIYIHTRK